MKSRTVMVATLAMGLLAGPSAGVTAQEGEAAAPVEFTARWSFGPSIREPKPDVVDGVIRIRGGAWRPGVVDEASDPRLRGELSLAANMDDFAGLGLGEVASVAFRIENDEGVWQQMPSVGITFPGSDHPGGVGVFIGEDGYAGFIAVVDINVEDGIWDLRGYIIDGDLPPAPEPYISR